MPTNYTIPDRANLISVLKKVRQDTEILAPLNMQIATDRIRQNFDMLNDCRQYHSSAQQPILETIFDVFDHVYYHSNDKTRQSMYIGFLTGFIRHLPSETNAQKEILNRLALIPMDKYNRHSFEIIGRNLIDSYVKTGYKKDTDNTLGNKLYALVNLVANIEPSKRNCAQQNWVHDNLKKLSKINPHFKRMLDIHPIHKPHNKIAGVALREATLESPIAFAYIKRKRFSHMPQY